MFRFNSCRYIHNNSSSHHSSSHNSNSHHNKSNHSNSHHNSNNNNRSLRQKTTTLCLVVDCCLSQNKSMHKEWEGAPWASLSCVQ